MMAHGKSIAAASGPSALSTVDYYRHQAGGPSVDMAVIYAAIPGLQAVKRQGRWYAFPTSIEMVSKLLPGKSPSIWHRCLTSGQVCHWISI